MPHEVIRRLSENKKLNKVVNVQNVLKSNSSSHDFKTDANCDPNIHVKFCKISGPVGNTIPELDEIEPKGEVQITTQTPLITQLSHKHKSHSISNSYLNQIKIKKNSINSITEIPEFENNLVNSGSPNGYGNDVSVENEKGQVTIFMLSMTF